MPHPVCSLYLILTAIWDYEMGILQVRVLNVRIVIQCLCSTHYIGRWGQLRRRVPSWRAERSQLDSLVKPSCGDTGY